MDERHLQLRVGLFVLLALVVLAILVFLHSEGFRSQYTIYVKSRSAPGVTKDTPIRKNGILIGRVGSVKTQDDEVVIVMRIYEDETVYANEVCSIGTDTFLGDSAIEIVPLAPNERGERLPDGASLRTVSIKRNPLDIIDVAINLETKITETLTAVRQASTSIEEAGQGFRRVTDQVSSALGQDDSDFKTMLREFREMSQKAQGALDNFNKLFDGINEVVSDPELRQKLNETVNKLPEIFDEFRLTIADTRQTINSFREISGSAGRNLDNLESFTLALKANGPEILEQIRTSVGNIDAMMEQVKQFSKSLSGLNDGSGTLGKLLKDPALYNNVNQAAANIKDITIQLEPLMNDLRMFADSIARDPRQLGVKGAMDNRPLGTGPKENVSGRNQVIRE